RSTFRKRVRNCPDSLVRGPSPTCDGKSGNTRRRGKLAHAASAANWNLRRLLLARAARSNPTQFRRVTTAFLEIRFCCCQRARTIALAKSAARREFRLDCAARSSASAPNASEPTPRALQGNHLAEYRHLHQPAALQRALL